MKNQKAFSVTIRGQVVNGATIGTLATALGKIDDKLTTFANAAAAQYVISGNRNWLDKLFQLDELRLTNGKLSAKGREVASYLRAFSPVNVAEKDENGVQTIAIKMNAKNRGVFYSLDKDDNGAKIKIDAASQPDWPLTLREFVNMEKEVKPPNSVKKAATVEKSLAKLIQGINDVSGTYEELTALAAMAEKLTHVAYKVAYAAQPVNADIEPVKAAEAASVTSGKEKRADTDRAKHNETAPQMAPVHARNDRTQKVANG